MKFAVLIGRLHCDPVLCGTLRMAGLFFVVAVLCYCFQGNRVLNLLATALPFTLVASAFVPC